MNLQPAQLVLRCYAQRDGDQWVAVCMDLTLAAQAESFAEARQKLHSQIAEYVFDAVAGEDRQFGDQLLPRRAPLIEWARYYKYVTQSRLGLLRESIRRLFTEILPLQPLRTA